MSSPIYYNVKEHAADCHACCVLGKKRRGRTLLAVFLLVALVVLLLDFVFGLGMDLLLTAGA